MEEKIKSLYTKLSNQSIENSDSVISTDVFSSVLLDRFTAELSKLGVTWDKEPTSINMLIGNAARPVVATSVSMENTVKKENSKTLAIGTDIQKLDKFPKVKDFWEEPFYTDTFSATEIGYCLKKSNPIESFAGIFAAKEAVFKATGIARQDVIINHTDKGMPVCDYASISISHDGDYAVATAFIGNQTIVSVSDDENRSIETIKPSVANIPKQTSHSNRLLWSLCFILIVGYIIYKEFLEALIF
ncbi:4'-phosphopantetheinyl transferase superfamily protein [Subsaximicrobium wynnwilliamsii]|uniref:4'-phosphopantetheinyl transferase superfamily protein n=1 Tax=Subsaximicrobium wynnwilliamsii TaxID=291179 RepID=A0A5C6ZKC8_9FLAO|nr:4'-phosphopantetheinyl transferase superfamily protein [Subsaximicrobium wynnwilliamsii]TXD81378.1 4'-phosphopantetheinyl transferase superfamily protein [Subsaximicrobium wynnwilliamsii]TXD89074.1 4'-phosphopantetheinyl transferase superfamily protein [Subsaximicrobium wynnwilliamsii]TXE00752.1 4'-phosphopantetheinyl transferase superfamily protein [Subsaximicrobium wynnwilliamsii]